MFLLMFHFTQATGVYGWGRFFSEEDDSFSEFNNKPIRGVKCEVNHHNCDNIAFHYLELDNDIKYNTEGIPVLSSAFSEDDGWFQCQRGMVLTGMHCRNSRCGTHHYWCQEPKNFEIDLRNTKETEWISEEADELAGNSIDCGMNFVIIGVRTEGGANDNLKFKCARIISAVDKVRMDNDGCSNKTFNTHDTDFARNCEGKCVTTRDFGDEGSTSVENEETEYDWAVTGMQCMYSSCTKMRLLRCSNLKLWKGKPLKTNVFSQNTIDGKDCYDGMVVSAIYCKIHGCEMIQLHCKKPYNFELLGESTTSWTHTFSEEDEGAGFCPKWHVMVGMQCEGNQCDNVKIKCRKYKMIEPPLGLDDAERYTIGGFWKYIGPIDPEATLTLETERTVTNERGERTEKVDTNWVENAVTHASSFSVCKSSSMSGMAKGMTMTASVERCVTNSRSDTETKGWENSVLNAMETRVTESTVETKSHSFSCKGPTIVEVKDLDAVMKSQSKCYLYQWMTFVMDKSTEKSYTLSTDNYDLIEIHGNVPLCVPGQCKDNTDCQECHKDTPKIHTEYSEVAEAKAKALGIILPNSGMEKKLKGEVPSLRINPRTSYMLVDGAPAKHTLLHSQEHLPYERVGEVQCCKKDYTDCVRKINGVCISGDNDDMKMTYWEAKSFCESIAGYELCSRNRLEGDKKSLCEGTGCQHDNALVWVKEETISDIVYTLSDLYLIHYTTGDVCSMDGEIRTAYECEIAAQALQLPYGGSSEYMWIGKHKDIPRGCSYNWSNNILHFNKRESSVGRSDLSPICRKKWYHHGDFCDAAWYNKIDNLEECLYAIKIRAKYIFPQVDDYGKAPGLISFNQDPNIVTPQGCSVDWTNYKAYFNAKVGSSNPDLDLQTVCKMTISPNSGWFYDFVDSGRFNDESSRRRAKEQSVESVAMYRELLFLGISMVMAVTYFYRHKKVFFQTTSDRV